MIFNSPIIRVTLALALILLFQSQAKANHHIALLGAIPFGGLVVYDIIVETYGQRWNEAENLLGQPKS